MNSNIPEAIHTAGDPSQDLPTFWAALITERDAAKFLGLTDRTMQAWRRKGGGPRYVKISSRCVRYRRADLRGWADARVRKSTSDPGLAAA